jgi:hypothetical protein
MSFHHGADVNAAFAGRHCETPLHWAAGNYAVGVAGRANQRVPAASLAGYRFDLNRLIAVEGKYDYFRTFALPANRQRPFHSGSRLPLAGLCPVSGVICR